MSFLLNSCLDIFEIRQKSKTIEQDLGLLHAVDERLATYGWLTNTGIKFTIVIDMAGRPAAPDDDDRRRAAPILGLRDSDLKPVRDEYNRRAGQQTNGTTLLQLVLMLLLFLRYADGMLLLLLLLMLTLMLLLSCLGISGASNCIYSATSESILFAR